MRTTGRGLDPQPYLEYLSDKYGGLYGLEPATMHGPKEQTA